ncbi:MAG: RNA 2',3'-cyclic phosphodiesterase [Proteobacteria bacterium]|nr:RNA 2',3'-cyclic phosphodiesterase [Pseudomonadota bacterium]
MTPQPASTAAGSQRCFLALLPDAASRAALQRCRELAAASPSGTRGVRWSDAASLHLTLRFLGGTSHAQVEYFKHMLPSLVRALPALIPRRCAIWPNRARPRLVVLEFDPLEALIALAGECEALAQKAGFDAEPRAFKAHLTLARLRPGCLPELPPAPTASMAFESLALMASDLQTTGARYRCLASTALPKSAEN